MCRSTCIFAKDLLKKEETMEINDLLKNKPATVLACVCSGIAVGVLVEAVKAARGKRQDNGLSEDVSDYLADHKRHIQEVEREYRTLEETMERKVGADFSKPDISELVDYTKFSSPVEKVLTENGKPVSETEPQNVNAPSVFEIISVEEFLKGTGNDDGYTSVVGTWFQNDGVLAGWNEQMEEKDPRSTIGEEALAILEDPDIKAVYVKNTHLKVLFEILKSDDSIEDVIREIGGQEKTE
jgi:hypothetical protein